MLKEFKVKGFKNFVEEIHFNLNANSNEYSFNNEIIKDQIVNKAVIYGINSSGKSNLGLALFDIVRNLTDKTSNDKLYRNYLSATGVEYAEFTYTFLIGKSHVTYRYLKSDYETIIDEELSINGSIVIKYDRRLKKEPIFNFPEADNLDRKIKTNISIVKYALRNTNLSGNTTLMRFSKFVDNMLFFKSVEGNKYIGFTNGDSPIGSSIIKKDLLPELNTFVRELGLDFELVECIRGEEKTLGFKFGEKSIPFYEIASSGTKDLILFYYWLTQFNDVSLVFIDEFDAHYHFELSRLVMKKIKKITNLQAIVTTHTTALLNNNILRPDCYFKIDNNQIESLSKLTTRSLEKAHNIEKIYRNGGFSTHE